MVPPVYTDEEALTFISPEPLPKRVLLIGAGFFALSMPAIELHRGLVPLTYASPFFAIIILGAALVGAVFLAGGILADCIDWRVEAGRINLDRRNLLRRRYDSLTAADISAIEVLRHDWDARPETFGLVVITCDGRRFATIDFGTEAEARALKAAVERRLGL